MSETQEQLDLEGETVEEIEPQYGPLEDSSEPWQITSPHCRRALTFECYYCEETRDIPVHPEDIAIRFWCPDCEDVTPMVVTSKGWDAYARRFELPE